MSAQSRILPYMAGGVGLAALENAIVGENLPPELKTVNYGLGATTGAMLASPDAKTRAIALSTIPIKQIGLFGVGAMDRLRRSQQDLTDTNLATAQINQATARTQRADAGGRKALMAAFLIPALLGGGALAYQAHLAAQKKRRSKDQTMSDKGSIAGRNKVRIDIPGKAVPSEFWSSLINIDDNPRARTRTMSKVSSDIENTPELDQIIKAASDAGVTVPSLLKTLLWESTGIPGIARSGQEIGRGYGSLESGDVGNAGRYGLSAAANAALSLVAMRLGVLPLVGKALGKARLGAWVGKGVPGSRSLLRHAYGHQIGPLTLSNGTLIPAAQRMARRQALGLSTKSPLNRLIESKSRYNPKRFAWQNPTKATLDRPLSAMFNRWLTEPSRLPSTRIGHAALAGRYLANRAINTGYRMKQWAGRYPNLTLSALATYPASQGVLKDQYEDAIRARDRASMMPRWSEERGYHGMPVSSMVSGLIQGLGGGNPSGGFLNQISR